MNGDDLIVWGRNIQTGVIYLIDPHVLTAFWCCIAAGLIAGGLILWLVIEAEMRSKK